jgi:hypothetical protein
MLKILVHPLYIYNEEIKILKNQFGNPLSKFVNFT